MSLLDDIPRSRIETGCDTGGLRFNEAVKVLELMPLGTELNIEPTLIYLGERETEIDGIRARLGRSYPEHGYVIIEVREVKHGKPGFLGLSSSPKWLQIERMLYTSSKWGDIP